MAGAFWGTRVLEIVKKHDSGGLLWKRIKLTSTRKANAKKRLHRVWQLKHGMPISSLASSEMQNEAVLRACTPAKEDKVVAGGAGEKDGEQQA